MDKIMARGMTFKGCHGVLPIEQTQPQTFKVDADLFLDTSQAGYSDDLKDTVSYAEVFSRVKAVVEQEKFQLIEALAEKIAQVLLRQFPLRAVEITVYKPDAPVAGQFDYFAVAIKRYRK